MNGVRMLRLLATRSQTTGTRMAMEINGYIRLTETGQHATWQVDLPAGTYRLDLEARSSGGSLLRAQVDGEWQDLLLPDTGWFHARLPLQPRSWRGGHATVRIELRSAVGRLPLALRALCLSPGAADDEPELAARERIDHRWLAESGYGLMAHWTAQSRARIGETRPYAEAVAALDAEALAGTIAGLGAAWFLFTVCHEDPHCPAPIPDWEAAFPGRTTNRDLLGDLARALDHHGIAFGLYLSSHILVAGCRTTDEAQERHDRLLVALGRAYGPAISWWWLDGWSALEESHPVWSRLATRDAARVGNPGRLLSCNAWTFPVGNPWQDVWAGEVVIPPPPMAGLPGQPHRYAQGPAPGLGRHLLLNADRDWVYRDPAPPRLGTTTLADCIDRERGCGGAVTINVALSQEGHLLPDTVAMLQEVRTLQRREEAW